MKKIYFSAILFLASSFAYAQNPLINPDFETWTWYDVNQTMEYPIYWSGDPGPFPVKSTDACSGNYSVLLTDSVYGVSVGGGVGVQQTAYFTGVPPIGVSFCYKYKSTPNDTAQFVTSLVSNSYASSASYGFNPTSVWTPATVYFSSYNGPGTDAFQLSIFAACSNAMHVSTDYSQLKIDDINFVYTTGINDKEEQKVIVIFPNPNNGTFTLKNKNSAKIVSVEIINMLGQQVYVAGNLNALTEMEITLSGIPNGIYFLKSYDGEKVYSGKITIQ